MAKLSYISKEIGYNYNDDALIKKTQKRLKKHDKDGLPSKMLKTVIKTMLEGEPVVSTLCDEVNVWIEAHNDQLLEVSYGMPKEILELIEQAKKEEDFITSYIFKHGKQNVWLIIKEADYDSSIKYIRLARKILNAQYIDLELMIYSEDEIEEVLDELMGSNINYKEIKNGK